MDNPLNKPRTPENFLQDIEDLARDLAYCVVNDNWVAAFRTFGEWDWGLSWLKTDARTNLQTAFEIKWVQETTRPNYSILAAYGFLDLIFSETTQVGYGGYRHHDGSNSVANHYILTQKAFDLLQKPSQAPSIFISYRRRESSTFALLVEARLRMAGADPKRIFIDKTIPIGDEWEVHLVERLTSCEVFICLVGKTAFEDGSWLQREIEILRSENPTAVILPILHNGVTMTDPIVQRFFGSVQSATVKEESALEYENAVNHILNRLGYETYWPSPTSPFSGL